MRTQTQVREGLLDPKGAAGGLELVDDLSVSLQMSH